MNSINTDIELSKEFKEPVSYDYNTALEFLTVNPDYSLLKFRDVISCLCIEIAKYKKINFCSDKLFDQIEFLFEYQIIHKQFKDNLHDTRILCNAGAHKVNSASSIDNQKEYFEQNKNNLKEKALKARKLVVQIFEDTYLVIKKGDITPSIKYVSAGKQEHKEILFEAATSLCDRVKLKAGVIYESIAEESLMGQPILVSNNFSYHHDSLYKLAASYYEASYKISANYSGVFDLLRLSNKSFEPDEFILQNCALEPLFNYSVIASEGRLGEENIEKGYSLIKKLLTEVIVKHRHITVHTFILKKIIS